MRATASGGESGPARGPCGGPPSSHIMQWRVIMCASSTGRELKPPGPGPRCGRAETLIWSWNTRSASEQRWQS
eukprot:5748443-Prymnesium_polylepis.1